MEENQYYRQDLFKLILEELLRRSRGISVASLVAADGFALAEAGRPGGFDNIDAFSALAFDLVKKARVLFSFDADEVVISDLDGNEIVCHVFEHVGETTGSFALVVQCTGEYDKRYFGIVVEKIKENLLAFY